MVAGLSGCRSGAQTDLVQREMRQQEDQIYALQDYLAEYQELVCQFREENESLKRRLADQDDFDSLPTQAEDLYEDELIDEYEAPAIDIGPEPGDPPLGAVLEEDYESPLEFYEPDLESLDPSVDGPTMNRAAEKLRQERSAARQRATAQSSQDFEPSPIGARREPLAQVAFRGEVAPGDEGEGPRVMVDVEPLSADGRPAEFDGDVSLMVLEQTVDGEEPRSVARWDVTAADGELIYDDQQDHSAMRFFLQLPPETPTDQPLDLWVRLVRADGEKTLAHSTLELDQSGRFASARPPGSEPRQAATDHETPAQHLSNFDPPTRNDWSVALPGIVQQAEPAAAGHWQQATQPVPEVARRPVRPLEDSTDDRYGPPTPANESPEESSVGWSPNRTRDATANSSESDQYEPTVIRPGWSPYR